MNNSVSLASRTAIAIVIVALAASPLLGEYRVTCESHHKVYKSCRLDQPGYVTLERQHSKAACIQGRTWDWDRREIWVNDGCKGDFRVETHGYDRHGKSDSHDAKVAAGVLLGAAILGALAQNENHQDDHKYRDENYYGGRHTSYIPSWMVGTFKGHNPMYGRDIVMTIQKDGRMTADADGHPISGYINDELIHVGNELFDIHRTHEGFVTSQRGHRHNEVYYRRID